MGTNYESVWLFKINPKVLEVLNQLLKAMEQLSMAPPKEEPIQMPDRMPGALLTVDEAAQRLAVSKYTLRGWVIPGCDQTSNIVILSVAKNLKNEILHSAALRSE